jgi:hypothetical protein
MGIVAAFRARARHGPPHQGKSRGRPSATCSRPVAAGVSFPSDGVEQRSPSPVSGARGSLGASRAGAWLSGSAADDEQADDEGEHDELKGDADGVLEAALQTGVAN